MLTMMPGRSLPQGVASNCGEVVIGPALFCLRDGALKHLDGIFARLALDGSDTGKGGLTVKVPPAETPEVRHVPSFEQLPRDGINVCIEGICSVGKGVNVRDIRCR